MPDADIRCRPQSSFTLPRMITSPEISFVRSLHVPSPALQ